jgi:hypothetical protein
MERNLIINCFAGGGRKPERKRDSNGRDEE